MAEVIKGVKLLVEEGRKKEDGTRAEPVAFYGARRGRNCIVFLPKGAVVGKTVRVDLLEVEKKDVRGNSMYRATPVAAEVSERWRENPDGSLTRFKVSTDWLGDEREVETFESRTKRRRESEAGTRSEFVPIWGSDLTASYVEERQLKVFEMCEEEIVNGKLANRKLSERTEPLLTTNRPVKELAHEHWTGTWWRGHLEVDWSKLTAHLTFYAVCPDCNRGQSVTGPFLQMPAFWQAEVEARYPVCQCGRSRRDTQVADSYDKCETCRAEDHCSRCGKQAKVAVIDGAVVCDVCKPWQAAEVALNAGLTADHKVAIAAEAKRLRTGEAYPQSEGEALLRALTNHFASDSSRESFTNRCADYHWHYVTAEGFFGTKFSPEALMLLEQLPTAVGNGLVELCTWMEHVKVTPGLMDYYVRVQLQEETGHHPFQVSAPAYWCERWKEKLEAGQPILADFLRGTEEDRQAALEAKRWLELQQAVDGGVHDSLRHVENVLEKSQDYASALKVFAEYKRSWERRKSQARTDSIPAVRGRFETDQESENWSFERANAGEDVPALTPKLSQPAVPVPATTTTVSEFAPLGDYNFRCPCGRSLRLTKGERRQYNAGNEVPVHCECSRSGTVKN